MSAGRWRLRPSLVLVVTGLSALALGVVYYASARALGSALEPAVEPGTQTMILRDFGGTYLLAAVIALLVAGVITFVLGWVLVQPLSRLRATALAWARGEPARESVDSPIREYHRLASALGRAADEAADRIGSLTQERDELTALVNIVSEGILQVGADGRVIHANPAARRLLGIPDHVVGQPLGSMIRQAELRAILERAITGTTTGTTEVSLDDRRLLVGARSLPPAPNAPAGERASTIVALIDLTEVRRLEGVRRDFVANVSHELKTPLTSIRGYVETLATDDLPDEMQRQFLDVIHKNTARLQGIVDDLLDLSRLESGGWRPELQAMDPLRFAEEVWSAHSEHAAGKRIEFLTAGGEARVLADPGGLRQVLMNLYDNALRYTAGGGRITVRIAEATTPSNGATREAGRVVIEVQDTGAGIPGDALPRIFERFYRADPARSRAEGGTGLGLSIVKHMMERMGGDVAAESELGKGTTIRLTLLAPAAGAAGIEMMNAE